MGLHYGVLEVVSRRSVLAGAAGNWQRRAGNGIDGHCRCGRVFESL